MTDDPEYLQRRSLRRHRRLATLLLLGMAALFLISHAVAAPSFWVLLARAASEAGIVGGLADWFAVTALFRHPLGVPIPHTAIIPRSKDRIGRGIGRFVADNFLAPDLVAERIRALDPATALGRWLSDPDNSRLVADRLVSAAPYLLAGMDERHVRRLFKRGARQRLRTLDLQPLAVQLLRMLIGTEYYHSLVDRLLAAARDLLLSNEERIHTAVAERSRWWVPARVDRRVAESVVTGLEELLDGLTRHDHPVREDFDRSVAELIDRLESSSAFARELRTIRERLLDSEAVSRQLDRVWEELRRTVTAEIDEEGSRLRKSLALAARSVGTALIADGQARRRLNDQLERVALDFVSPFRAEIGRFIEDVVRSWDTRTVTERVELAVGRDLQYIRINGTLVGALVGALLFLAVKLF